MTIQEVLKDVRSGSRKKVILDTDTYNEIDDQYAVAWALLENGKKMDLVALNAAPFHNENSSSAGDGMEKSYDEIKKLQRLVASSGYDCAVDPESVPVYKGATEFLRFEHTEMPRGSVGEICKWLENPVVSAPVETPAVRKIIDTVKSSDTPVYVLAIGAITNVATAIMLAPEIVDNMVVVWLGGHDHKAAFTTEFNMVQDVPAARVIFNSKVPFLQIPCRGVCDYLNTTMPELRYYLDGKTPLSTYLCNNVEEHCLKFGGDLYGYSKVIWDVSTVAALVCPDALEMVITPTPILTADCRYAFDNARHQMIVVRRMNRDRIFKYMFKLLAKD